MHGTGNSLTNHNTVEGEKSNLMNNNRNLSSFVINSAALLTKLFLNLSTNLTTSNQKRFVKLLTEKPKDVPLITFSNHTATVDGK